MAKRTITAKELIVYLREEGFREITDAERREGWYEKAAERPSCLRATQKGQTKTT